ncbi:MAG: hypothetical protein M0022_03970, partial [Desulfobacteraceae bacterium]|nr:hypothetical protein [Desulfobacteraceae bacterium]
MLAVWSSQAMASTAGDGITLGAYAPGQLITTATFNTTGVDTLVGLTYVGPGTSSAPATIYWAWMDDNSQHLRDGEFTVTSNQYYAFDLRTQVANDAFYGGKEGYLVFSVENPATLTLATTGTIAANAFMIEPNSAVFVPAVPLLATDYANSGTTPINPMGADTIISAAAAIPQGDTVDMRYWIDPAFGASTAIKLWSVCDVTAGLWQKGQTL